MRNFFKQDDGIVSVVYSFLIVLLVSIGGAAFEFDGYTSSKSKLNAISDSAILAAVGELNRLEKEKLSEGSPAEAQADAIQKAVALAKAYFTARTENFSDATVAAPSISIVKSKKIWRGSLTYRATYHPYFGSFLGVGTLNISNVSRAAVSASNDKEKKTINLHILLDASSSMGIGANNSELQRMFNAVGCVFACHVKNESSDLNLIAQRGIQTRFDVLKIAVKNLITKISAFPKSDGDFYIEVWTFDEEIRQRTALSNDYADLRQRVDAFHITTRRASTRVDVAMNSLAQWIARDRDPKEIEIAIVATDGLNSSIGDKKYLNKTRFDPANRYTYTGVYRNSLGRTVREKFFSNGLVAPVYPDQCLSLKNTKTTVAVLYTTYRAPVTYGDEKDIRSLFENVLTFGDAISDSLKACASKTDLYVEVTQGNDLLQGLEDLFEKSHESIMLRLE